jgi:hypothetical protein
LSNTLLLPLHCFLINDPVLDSPNLSVPILDCAPLVLLM